MGINVCHHCSISDNICLLKKKSGVISKIIHTHKMREIFTCHFMINVNCSVQYYKAVQEEWLPNMYCYTLNVYAQCMQYVIIKLCIGTQYLLFYNKQGWFARYLQHFGYIQAWFVLKMKYRFIASIITGFWMWLKIVVYV